MIITTAIKNRNTPTAAAPPMMIRRSLRFAFSANSAERCILRRSASRRISSRDRDSISSISRSEEALCSNSCRRISADALTDRKACARGSNSLPHPLQRSIPLQLIWPQPGQVAVRSTVHCAQAGVPAAFTWPHRGQRVNGSARTTPQSAQRKPPRESGSNTAPHAGHFCDSMNVSDPFPFKIVPFFTRFTAT